MSRLIDVQDIKCRSHRPFLNRVIFLSLLVLSCSAWLTYKRALRMVQQKEGASGYICLLFSIHFWEQVWFLLI